MWVWQCWRRLEDCRAKRRVWLGERSRGRRSRRKNRLEVEQSPLPDLKEVAEDGIVCIAILACLLSYPKIVKKFVLKKLNIEFESVHVSCCDVSVSDGDMVGVNNFAFCDEICHCEKWR